MSKRLNRAKCGLCGDIIISRSQHDFQECKCGNIFIDGGLICPRAGAKQPQHFLRFIKGKWVCGLKKDKKVKG